MSQQKPTEESPSHVSFTALAMRFADVLWTAALIYLGWRLLPNDALGQSMFAVLVGVFLFVAMKHIIRFASGNHI